MKTKSSLSLMILTALLAVGVAPGPLSAQMKIYIVTDLEGISGVYKFSQTREADTPLNIQAMEYFMGDVAAVVRGLRDAGRNRNRGARRPRVAGRSPAAHGTRGEVRHRHCRGPRCCGAWIKLAPASCCWASTR